MATARETVTRKFIAEHLEGSTIDLSLCFLEEVPVQELSKFNFKTLDLSQNRISSVESSFCSLTFIVEIDFSKNSINALPDNFGEMKNLQKLDLYGNLLETLPLSFSKLKSLRWLDLRDNNLQPDLLLVAGDCSNELECKTCAKKIVSFLSKEVIKETKKAEYEQDQLRVIQRKKEKKRELKLRQAKKVKEENKEKRRIAWENSLKLQNNSEVVTLNDGQSKSLPTRISYKIIGVVIVLIIISLTIGFTVWLFFVN